VITHFNKSAQNLANLVCVAGCGTFRGKQGTVCPRCAAESKPQKSEATAAPGWPETKGDDF
jgi:uncharacterized Zn finger protein (UPF0148 family)